MINSSFIKKIKAYGPLWKDTFRNFADRDPFKNSSVIAYYTIFSLPGLLVIIINLAGYFFGNEAVTNQITTQVQGTIGPDTAEAVQSIIANAAMSNKSVITTIFGIATLLFGATGVFYQLQQILNAMWEVKPQPKKKILKLLRDRAFSFSLILAVGFLMLVSLVLSAGLSALSDWVSHHLSESLLFIFSILDVALSIAFVTVLIAAIYKFLPDAKVQWKDVWIGSVVTAVLFVITKFALGFYFGKANPGSTYGAAGSVILIMLWVTYVSMILLLGAEFTQVYARRFGTRIEPTEGAISTAQDTDEPDVKKHSPPCEEKTTV